MVFFLHEILEIWCELNYENRLNSLAHFHSQILWNNSLIRIDKKIVFYKKWSIKDIVYVKDLLEANDTEFLLHADFQSTFNIKVNVLDYLGMTSTLKQLKKSCPKHSENGDLSLQQNFCITFI